MLISIIRNTIPTKLCLYAAFSKGQRQTNTIEKTNKIKFTEEDRLRIYRNTRDIYRHGMTAEELKDSP